LILRNGLRTARAGLLASSAANIATATFLSGVLGGGTAKVRELAEVRQIKRDVRKAETAPQDGTPKDTVEIRLGDLQEGLNKALVTQGREKRTGLSADDRGIKSVRGSRWMLTRASLTWNSTPGWSRSSGSMAKNLWKTRNFRSARRI